MTGRNSPRGRSRKSLLPFGFGAMKSASSSLGFATTPSMVIQMRLLDPSHSRFEDISKHKPVYVLVVAEINLQSAASCHPCVRGPSTLVSNKVCINHYLLFAAIVTTGLAKSASASLGFTSAFSMLILSIGTGGSLSPSAFLPIDRTFVSRICGIRTPPTDLRIAEVHLHRMGGAIEPPGRPFHFRFQEDFRVNPNVDGRSVLQGELKFVGIPALDPLHANEFKLCADS